MGKRISHTTDSKHERNSKGLVDKIGRYKPLTLKYIPGSISNFCACVKRDCTIIKKRMQNYSYENRYKLVKKQKKIGTISNKMLYICTQEEKSKTLDSNPIVTNSIIKMVVHHKTWQL